MLLTNMTPRSSRGVMFVSSILAAGTGAIALLIGQMPAHYQGVFVLAPVFLLIGFSQAGLRLGRKTYLVDGAPDDERPLYIAVSNTLIGVVTIFGGGLGLLVYSFGVRSVIFALIVLALIAAAVCRALPEAHEMAGAG